MNHAPPRAKGWWSPSRPTASAQLYLRASVDGVTDNTRFSQYGATKMAGLVVQGIQEQNLPLTTYLR